MASNLFALAAVVFGLLALILYFRNPGGGIAPVPVASPRERLVATSR